MSRAELPVSRPLPLSTPTVVRRLKDELEPSLYYSAMASGDLGNHHWLVDNEIILFRAQAVCQLQTEAGAQKSVKATGAPLVHILHSTTRVAYVIYRFLLHTSLPAVGQNVTLPATSLSAPIRILRAFPLQGGGTVCPCSLMYPFSTVSPKKT